MPHPVSLERRGRICVITADNPPVNALSHEVRKGLLDAIETAERDGCEAIVLQCAGRTWFAGADIREFGKAPEDPWLPEVLDRIESCEVPVVAALHGTALGGGLETALAAHYRIGLPDARFGFPEVNLGLLPGAGGTQRAPRLMGVKPALDLMLSGKPIPAPAALKAGLIDRIADGDLLAAALAWSEELVRMDETPPRTSTLPVPLDDLPEDFFETSRKDVVLKSPHQPAPRRIVDCVEIATRTTFDEGSVYERKAFADLMDSPESAALRHVFFAEREAARVEDLPKDTPQRKIGKVGIVGAGTMGGGIAMSFANAGIPVTILEVDDEALDRGLNVVRKNYERSAAKGRFTPEQARANMARILGTIDYADFDDADLVIEAVFEDPEIKKDVFRKLDVVCKEGSILASNTSYQDIDAIAAVTSRPRDVVGMHFFSPANVMKLLEVVRGEKTADDVLATVMSLARRIRKVPVLARVCYGFIGNRMLEGYFREAQMLLLEGATPAQVDAALENFGMAMGPLAVGDLAGLDVGYKARQARGGSDHPSTAVADRLVEQGRLGQKSGAGYYRYDPETRRREEDGEVLKIIREEAARLHIEARKFTDDAIVERVIYPLINEGARVLEEGVAQRPGDIDIVYLYGYGFPAWRGGPMWYGSTVGTKTVYEKICEFRDTLGRPEDWQPAPLLEQLAADNEPFG